MKGDDIQKNILKQACILRDVLNALNQGIFGVALIVDDKNVLRGIFTDGDVRRALLSGASLDESVESYMNTEFIYGSIDNSHEDNARLLSEKIRHVPILDKRKRPVDLISWAKMWRLPVSAPYLGGNELKYVSDCITSGWISSQGPFVKKFEELFSEYYDSEAVATSSGTTALHLALLGLGVGPGDEVIVPDLTFGATANVVVHAGATPVFVDVTEETWTLDPVLLEEAITDRTAAIMPVHLYGHPCDMDAIMEIARKRNLFVVEDCAQALGAHYKSQLVGTFGDVACFSFFANKVITTGEGGMVITRNKAVKERVSILRDHGMSKAKRYWHESAGFNYRMTNVQAAIGVAQMENLATFLTRRRDLANYYSGHLADIKGVVLPHEAKWAENIFWLYTVLLDENKLGISVAEFITAMAREGVETRPCFYPLHEQPPYPRQLREFPVTTKISRQGISLPTSNNIEIKDAKRICKAFRTILKNVEVFKNVDAI